MLSEPTREPCQLPSPVGCLHCRSTWNSLVRFVYFVTSRSEWCRSALHPTRTDAEMCTVAGILDQDLRNAGIHSVNKLEIVLQENIGKLDRITYRLENVLKRAMGFLLVFQWLFFVFVVLIRYSRTSGSVGPTLMAVFSFSGCGV